jgi:multiple sugar transport system substrate-binding protein
MPMEAFIKVYLYRLDLFNDPDIQKAYKDKFGKDLAPATTHEDYTQIAEFFTDWGKDKDVWGTTVQAANGHSSSFYEFFESVAPTFGVYTWGINMDNWKATVANGGTMNSDKAKAALTWWTSLLKYAPPEATQSTWDEVAASFAAGRAAQGLVYGENAVWIATKPERSKVVGEVGVAMPPLEPGVLDEAKAGKGYIGYYDGGAFGLPITSKNKEATLLWLQFIGQPSVQPDWAIAGSRITMAQTFDDPKVKEADAKTDNYFTKLKDDGYLYAGAPPFPFHAAIRAVVEPFIWKAITGELSVSDALDQAAVAAESELVKLGYGK